MDIRSTLESFQAFLYYKIDIAVLKKIFLHPTKKLSQKFSIGIKILFPVNTIQIWYDCAEVE